MIRINGDLIVNKYISIPQDLREGGLNTAAFAAGMVNGILDAAEFVSGNQLFYLFVYLFAQYQLHHQCTNLLLVHSFCIVFANVCYISNIILSYPLHTQPAKVSAHYVKPKTVILIKFDHEVIDRDKRMKQ